MQFRKIDEHKIHCIISQEEMSQKGIQIEDFLDHRDKTEAFLREILAEAKYELNLDEDMGRCFSVQMAVMPEGDVSLVISGEDHGSTGDFLFFLCVGMFNKLSEFISIPEFYTKMSCFILGLLCKILVCENNSNIFFVY